MPERFNYITFMQNCLDRSETPIMPSGLQRAAMEEGATHEGEELSKKLRQACECLALRSGYKRIRVAGVRGYQYEKCSE